MALIELRGIAHRYDATSEDAVKPLDLVWQDGGAYALLGPSGCGKSTLLGIISGLLKPSRGAVLIDGRDVTALSPRERNVAQVFQFPVIYDTMTVFENLSFPLRNRGVARAEIATRVAQIAALLELDGDLQRRASGLPGELKQRISLGRGLVRRDVAAILLDEPLTVIDPHLKWLLRRKLMEIHAELRVTLIYVTHDQLEALTLADRVVVMNDGFVLQQGSPEALFEKPEHVFVGHFIGSPGMNILPCAVSDGELQVEGEPVSSHAGAGAGARARANEQQLQLGIRPEFVRLHDTPGAATPKVTITRHVALGGSAITTVRLGTHDVNVKTDPNAALAAGDERYLEFPAAHTHLYRDGRLLAEPA
jgi:glycerol transport system ATP-binding protein